MSRNFRGALIGCGFFARNHMHGWADAEGAEIVAVCDLDRAKAETFARDFAVAGVFTDAAAMLAEIRPDFVDVATTVPSHRPLVELATAAGALTICQKPFAETYADGAAMVAAADRAGVPLIVHENFRWQLPFLRLKARLDAGAIGRPAFARLSFRHGYDVYANQPYLAEVADFALMDVGLHLFDLSRFLMGDVTSVHCRTQTRNPRVRGEDDFLASLRHVDGAVTSVECGFFSTISPDPFPQTLAWIEGETGTLEVTGHYRLRLHRRGGVEEESVDPAPPAWGARPWHAVQDSVGAFERHVVAVLRGEAEPQPSGAHNLETLALTIAAYRSADRDEAVRLADFVAEGTVR
jgi:predicted dehydrogenase